MTDLAEKQTLGFQAEVKQLLHLMIHSLYSNKEIFLRELISNASDAIDKLRFAALGDPALLENESELKIHIAFDKTARTITITDNGVGMTRQEVIDNLGTIARSGTREFLQSLSGDQAKDAHLIGQFGVGFYSSFIVADKVTVLTRRAGLTAEHGVKWESNGEGDYSIENIEKNHRGTQIILHLRPQEDELLDEWHLRHIITKYSDHIMVPITMTKRIEPPKDQPEEPVREEIETVNRATALWARAKNDISENDYKEFYKHISHDFEDPLLWSHNRVEGKQEYTLLLYIPSHAPFDLFQREKPHGLKLYVKRVFIMDDAEQFLPLYLRFVRGVVDSSDLSLNISREILQESEMVKTIKAGCTRKVLELLETTAKEQPEKYQKFWQAFGKVLKEGPGEDFANREKIAKLLRFSSTHTDSADQTVSLDDYIARMKTGQDKIYYITAENYLAAYHSPHLEIFRKKGIEVLLLSDNVDEWLVAHLTEYAGKSLQSIAKGDLDLGNMADETEKQQQEQLSNEFESVTKHMKEILEKRAKDVRVTHRLTESPACVVSDAMEMGGHIQRLLKAAGHQVPESQPILEINPQHALIQKLRQENDDDRFKELTLLLFDQAVLAESGQLANASEFVQRLNKWLLAAV